MDDYLSKPVQRMPLLQKAGSTHSGARSRKNKLPHTQPTHTITHHDPRLLHTHTRMHARTRTHAHTCAHIDELRICV